jgi:acyl-CoA synthetase (NDP forming)
VNTIPPQVSEQLSAAIKTGKSVLTMEESRKIIELSGIPINKSGLATSGGEAVKLANEIGYPIVMKIISPQIIHKTDVGGVKVNITSEDEVIKYYNEIVINVKEKVPNADIKGVLLEEMVHGPEFIVGTTVDPQFGHIIMFGIGGIFVEIYKDVSFRLVPINQGDAEDMLNEIKGKPLLDGVRGFPKANREQLVNILLRVSDLVSSNPIIQEMDINPLIATEKGIVAVDAKIILSQIEEAKSEVGLQDMISKISKLSQ